MAGAAGTNVDKDGFIFDPTLDSVSQHYKEIGMHNYLRDSMGHVIGGYRTVKIPTASMLTLNGTPIQIVPAPGAGKIIIPMMMIGSMVFNSAAYATNAAGATLRYGTAGAGVSTLFTFSQAFLQSVASAVQVVNHPSAATYLPVSTDYNVPLTLIAGSADPTTGDSDLYVRVFFRVVTLPFTNPSLA